MKKNSIILFLCVLFTCTGFVTGCHADASPYERVKTLIWKTTIHFIYEDNDMMDQYWKNYGDQPFNNLTDFDSLKDEASEKTFYSSVEAIVNKAGIAKKVALERLVNEIAYKLSTHPKRQGDTDKLVKVNELQRMLYTSIQEEYQEEQYQAQSTSNVEEINNQSDNTSSSHWFIIVLLVIILLLMGFAIWQMGKLVDRFAKKVKYVLEEREFQSDSPPDMHTTHLSPSDMQKEMEGLKKQIIQLHALIEQTSSSRKETRLPENPNMTTFANAPQKETQSVKENRSVLYYAKISNDSLFKQENLTTADRPDNIYCIREETDGVATFSINDDIKVQGYALQNGGEMFLRDACEIQYENNRPTQIITDVPGKLVREGKHWRIREKARVSLK